jgi:hypothetical protein
MAQATANPGTTYRRGTSHRRALTAAAAAAVAIALAAFALSGPNEGMATERAAAALSPVASIAEVDDFVSRRYLSNPIPGDDSWKDDHITRRYLPGD